MVYPSGRFVVLIVAVFMMGLFGKGRGECSHFKADASLVTDELPSRSSTIARNDIDVKKEQREETDAPKTHKPKKKKKKSKKKKSTTSQNSSSSSSPRERIHKSETPEEERGHKSEIAEDNKEDWTYILSIDGGGIRGIIPAQILSSLEENLTRRYSNCSKPIRIVDLFDRFAGTSTGGIIVLGLVSPLVTDPLHSPQQGYPAQNLLALYKDKGKEIFPAGGPARWKDIKGLLGEKYSSKPLQDILKHKFEETYLADVTKPVLIPTYDLDTVSPYVFDSELAGEASYHNYRNCDVARATSAAPTYFSAAKIKSADDSRRVLVDGGIVMNNPAEAAYRKARLQKKKRIFLVSLGTGSCPPDSIRKLAKSGGAKWAPELPMVMMKASSDLVDQNLNKEAESLKNEGGLDFEYVRLQPTLPVGLAAMDNTDPASMEGLVNRVQQLIREDVEFSRKYNIILNVLEERLWRRGIQPDSDLPMKYLAQVSRLGRVPHLYFQGDEVTDDIVLSVIKEIKNRYGQGFTFESLTLMNTQITVKSLPDLMKKIVGLFSVPLLSFEGSPQLGPSGISQLANLLPETVMQLNLQNIGFTPTENLLFQLSMAFDTIPDRHVYVGQNGVPQTLQATIQESSASVCFEEIIQDKKGGLKKK